MDFSHIQARLEKPTSKATNQRSADIEPFVIKLNNSRLVGGYKPYSAAFVASKMSHIDTDELHFFYKKLDTSKNFCALWHYFCKPKKKTGDKLVFINNTWYTNRWMITSYSQLSIAYYNPAHGLSFNYLCVVVQSIQKLTRLNGCVF